MTEETPQISYMEKITNNVKTISKIVSDTLEKLQNIPKANIEAGIIHMRQGNFFDAFARFRIAAWLDKTNYIAHYLMGKALVYNGKRSKAIKHLRMALQLNPALDEAKFLLAVCGGGDNLAELPRSYIIDRNDTIAQNYNLVFSPEENTNFKSKFRQEFAEYFEDWQGFNVLDIGCMGGEMGEIIKPKANHLVGVEPSIKIAAIAKARRNGENLTYNKIVTKFPEDYLAENDEHFQVVLAVHYLSNFANPLKALKLARKVISKEGGVFIFTITPTKEADYKFSDTKILFLHSEEFIEKCLNEAGFVLFKKSELKYESGNIDLIYIAEAA